MRKYFNKIWIFVALFSFPFWAKGQLTHGFRFGIKAGVNYNELKGSNFNNVTQKDWHLGLYSQVLGEKWGLGAEGIYDRSRYELRDFLVDAALYKFTGDTTGGNSLLQAHKFQIPVYIIYRLGSFLQLQLGGVYEGVIRFKDKENFIADTKSIFQKSYPSLMGGLWIDITPRINIGGRYLIGLDKVTTDNINQKWRTREAQLHLGYKL